LFCLQLTSGYFPNNPRISSTPLQYIYVLFSVDDEYFNLYNVVTQYIGTSFETLNPTLVLGTTLICCSVAERSSLGHPSVSNKVQRYVRRLEL
jgi:hypothetical protein